MKFRNSDLQNVKSVKTNQIIAYMWNAQNGELLKLTKIVAVIVFIKKLQKCIHPIYAFHGVLECDFNSILERHAFALDETWSHPNEVHDSGNSWAEFNTCICHQRVLLGPGLLQDQFVFRLSLSVRCCLLFTYVSHCLVHNRAVLFMLRLLLTFIEMWW